MTQPLFAGPSSDHLARIVGRRVFDECDDDEYTTRRVLVTAWLVVNGFVPIWGAIYILFDETRAGLIPIIYCAISVVSFGVLRQFGGWEWMRRSQLIQHLVLPFLLMWELGGFAPSSAVLIWALLAPLSSLWAGRRREAAGVMAGFVALTVASAILESHLDATNNIPRWAHIGFFAGNFIAMTGVVFVVLDFFARQKDATIKVMRRNRELESAYLAQEVSLRQSDKLATIGKLSAGFAHELNNPAAAAQQAAQQLRSGMAVGGAGADLAGLGLTDEETTAVRSSLAAAETRAVSLSDDPLARSDVEDVIGDVLADHGVEEPWNIAPGLAALCIGPAEVAELAAVIATERFAPVLTRLASTSEQAAVVNTLDVSVGRIVELVSALKSYSYLDQAPRQSVDVHEGIESTLTMLRHRLIGGIEIERDFDQGLPPIEAFGTELNQVWTNIIDNALDALGTSGRITITTRPQGDRVDISIADDGPGVPQAIARQVFDPFVTTKAPGEGTGLGLNIAHNIVVQKHGGELDLESEPGSTVFTVRLPVRGVSRTPTP